MTHFKNYLRLFVRFFMCTFGSISHWTCCTFYIKTQSFTHPHWSQSSFYTIKWKFFVYHQHVWLVIQACYSVKHFTKWQNSRCVDELPLRSQLLDWVTLDLFFNLSDNSLRLIIVLTNKAPDKDREEHVSLADSWSVVLCCRQKRETSSILIVSL